MKSIPKTMPLMIALRSSAVASALCAISTGLLVSTAAVAGETPHMGHAVPASSEAELQMMDTDKDGKISAAEHKLGARAMFDSMDSDKNAVVTAVEMDAAQKAATGSKSKAGEVPAGKLSSAEKIKVVDGNGDGKLTAEEHVAGAQKMFGTMDADRDGMLTLAELDAGRKMMLSSK
jgi:Ca2+-binding EF-hand superfamily protein